VQPRHFDVGRGRLTGKRHREEQILSNTARPQIAILLTIVLWQQAEKIVFEFLPQSAHELPGGKLLLDTSVIFVVGHQRVVQPLESAVIHQPKRGWNAALSTL